MIVFHVGRITLTENYSVPMNNYQEETDSKSFPLIMSIIKIQMRDAEQ